jgi:hypothetical protein
MAVVNKYWIPPNWICLSLTVMEIFTVFIPCYMVAFRSKALHTETLAAIKVWEAQKQGDSSYSPSLESISGTTANSHGFVAFNGLMTDSKSNLTASDDGSNRKRKLLFGFSLSRSPPTNSNSDTASPSPAMFPPNPAVNPGIVKKLPAALFSRDALEHCLRLNPDPLQQFAALKDFSGENVAFLTSVRQWKARCGVQSHSRGQSLTSPPPPPAVPMEITKETSITITSLPPSVSSFSRPFHRSYIIANDPNSPSYLPHDHIAPTLHAPMPTIPSTIHQPQPQPQHQHHTNPALAQRTLARQRRHHFNLALRIYAASISYEHSTFPVNLSSKDRKALEAIFSEAARTLFGRRGVRRGSADSADSGSSGRSGASEMTLWNAWEVDGGEKQTGKHSLEHVQDGVERWDASNASAEDGPFGPIVVADPPVTETPVPAPPACQHCGAKHSSLLPVLHPVTGTVVRRSGESDQEDDDVMAGPEEILKGRGVWYYGEIPEGFGMGVFDEAVESVLGMVLMDTWPKFVRSGGGVPGGVGV